MVTVRCLASFLLLVVRALFIFANPPFWPREVWNALSPTPIRLVEVVAGEFAWGWACSDDEETAREASLRSSKRSRYQERKRNCSGQIDHFLTRRSTLGRICDVGVMESLVDSDH